MFSLEGKIKVVAHISTKSLVKNQQLTSMVNIEIVRFQTWRYINLIVFIEWFLEIQKLFTVYSVYTQLFKAIKRAS